MRSLKWRPLRVLAALLCSLFSVPLGAQERFGNIQGRVVDPNGGVLSDVSVTLTNKVTQRSFTTRTGADGKYYARDLDPGRYRVRFETASFSTFEVADVNLLLGKTLDVDAALQLGGLTEVVQVTDRAPLIDLQSTTRGHNVPAEEFDNLPKTRSFQSMALTSPSVNAGGTANSIEAGVQVNGASASENNFTVDGLSVDSQIHGHQRQDALYDFLQEVQVKTSGLEAEYGGALGGVISAVTKSGGNTFKGEAHYYFAGDLLSANHGLSKRLVLDPTTQTDAYFVQDTSNDFTRHEIGASLGGPIMRDKLFFYASISPEYRHRERNYLLNSGTTPATIKNKTDRMSAFGKLTYEPMHRLRTSVSVLYTPEKSTGTLNAFKGDKADWDTASVASIDASNRLGYDQPQWSATGTVDYIVSHTGLLSLRGGYFHDNYKDTGIDTHQTFQYATSSIGLEGVPVALQQPAGYFNLRPTSLTDHDLTTRTDVQLDFTQTLTVAGTHNFKVGAGIQRMTNDVEKAFPNDGFVTIFWNTSFDSPVTAGADPQRGAYGYYTIDDQGTKGVTGANIYSLFIQDLWHVHSRLTLNLGLRTEKEDIPTFRPDIQKYAIRFGWGDKLAPRLGVTYDVLGNGKLKAYGSWGRYFDWTKYQAVRSSFGGDLWQTRYRALDTTDVASLSRANMVGRNLWTSAPDSYQDRRIPSFGSGLIDPHIKPMSQDVIGLGAEYQISLNTVLTANYTHTHLRRTIEDLGHLVNGSEVYSYGNPGEGMAATTLPTGLTAPFSTPKPKRTYDAMELTVNRRFDQHWFLGASYVLSRLWGNYSGTASTDEISSPSSGRSSAVAQQQSGSVARAGGVHRGWDLDELMWDAHGRLDVTGLLATDRPHVFKVYGSYNFDFGSQVGLFWYGGSGTPVSRVVSTNRRISVLVDGRGSMGRTPFLSQLDLVLSHEIKVGGSRRLRLELNTLNVLNQKTARHIWNSLNRFGADGRVLPSSALNLASVDLVKGYDYLALLAQTADGQTSFGYKDPRFGFADLLNDGLSARLGVKLMF